MRKRKASQARLNHGEARERILDAANVTTQQISASSQGRRFSETVTYLGGECPNFGVSAPGADSENFVPSGIDN